MIHGVLTHLHKSIRLLGSAFVTIVVVVAAPVAQAAQTHGVGPGPETPLFAGAETTFSESPPAEVTLDGRFVQRVPVDVPTFHGLEPRIGLEYDSRAGNGVAGWGFRLVGDSTIERLSRGRGTPRMTASDVFLLDGMRLVPCDAQPTPGVSCRGGGTHSTETETFQRIRREADRWLVWSRDGTLSTYTSWPGAAAGRVYGLASRENAHGDAIAYHRRCDESGTCYLDEIEYRDAARPGDRTRIRFAYETRPDPISKAIGVGLVTARERLLSIEVRTAGATRSALALRYTPASLTLGGASSRLAGVTRYGRDAVLDHGRVTGGTALPPESFSWESPDLEAKLLPGDAMQGDPGPAPPPSGKGAYADASQPDAVKQDGYIGDRQWLMADVNGDGRDDYVGAFVDPDGPSGTVALQVRLSRGDGTFSVTSQSTTWPDRVAFSQGSDVVRPYFRLLTGDVNDDGRADLVCVFWDEKTGSGQLLAEAALGTPSGFLSQQGTATTGITTWSPRTRWFLGDTDGDGLQDLIGVHGVDGNDADGYAHAGILTARSDGQRFSSLRETSTHWTFEPRDDPHWFPGDANGDGLTDVLRVEAVPGIWKARIETATAAGDGSFALNSQLTSADFAVPTFNPEFMASQGTAMGGELAQIGDFDADGRSDLLLVQPKVKSGDTELTTYFTTAFSRGAGSFELVEHRTAVSPWWLNSFLLTQYRETVMANRWLVTDIDGDGSSDIVITVPAAHILRSDTSDWPTTVAVVRLRSHRDGTFDAVKFPLTTTDWFFECYERIGVYTPCRSGTRHAVLAGDTNGDGRGDVAYVGPGVDGATRLATLTSSGDPVDDHHWLTTDVTGDGRPDEVYVGFSNPGLVVSTAIADPAAPGGYRLVRRAAAGAERFGSADMRRWIPGDFGSPDGGPDGRADLMTLTYDPASRAVRSTLLLSRGNGEYLAVDTELAPTGADPSTKGFIPVDANGDGLLDLVRAAPFGDAVTMTTTLADGAGGWRRLKPEQVSVPWRVFGAARFTAADVDGDGLGDLVHDGARLAPGGLRDERLFVLRSDGEGHWSALGDGYHLPGGTVGSVGAWRPAELNGDGRHDLVRMVDDGGLVRVDRLLSEGDGGFRFRSLKTSISIFGAGWLTVDEDADGCDDLAWIEPASTNDTETRIRRIANTCANLVSMPTKVRSRLPAALGWRSADVLGDGTQQLVRMSAGADAPKLAVLRLGAAPRLLGAVYSALGLETRVHYGTSAGAHALMPPGLTLPVVETRSTSAVPGGDTGTSRYAYSGLRWSYGLQRTLGFARVTVTDDRRIVETDQLQTPGCAGAVSRQTISSRTWDNLLRVSTSYHGATDAGAKPPWRCIPDEVVREECDGKSCRNIVTHLAQDDFGNETGREQLGAYADANHDSHDDLPADNRRSETLYVPNLVAWIVSRPARERTFDANGALAAERSFTYDGAVSPEEAPTRGDVRVQTIREPHVNSGAPGSLSTTYVHDEHGNVTNVTDPSNHTTTTHWDDTFSRFPERTCNPLWCTDTTWDAVVGRPLISHDANKLETSQHWDALGRHTRTDLPDGGCVVHDYPKWGVLIEQRIVERRCVTAGGEGDHGMLAREERFDGLHRVWREDRPGGALRERRFDFDSTRIASETAWAAPGDPRPRTRFLYDALGRPTLTIHPDNSQRSIRYEPGIEAMVDETNRQHTIRRLDGLGRPTSITEEPHAGDAETTTFEHDALDQLTATTDPTGLRTTRDVGPLGWVWQECDPDRGCVSRSFFADGSVKKEVNRAGESLQYDYDSIGRRVVQRAYDASGALVDRATWTYDRDPQSGEPHDFSIGQVTATRRDSSDATEQRWYDKGGRSTRVRTCIAADCVETETRFDAAGRPATVRYPADWLRPDETVAYGYDDAGRVRSLGRYIKDLGYTPADQISDIAFGHGVTETRTYDADRGWLRGVTVSGLTGTWPTVSTTYPTIDQAGRLTGEDRTSPAPYQKRYAYDGAGRIEHGPEAETVYDHGGRPTERSPIGALSYDDALHAHAITESGAGSYTYDATGRMLTSPTTSGHQWSPIGRLLAVTTPKGVVRYAYDADGRRVARETAAGRTLYSADNLVEVTPDGSHLRAYYASGRLMARSATLGDVNYYHPDRRGSIAYVTQDTGSPQDTPRLLQIYNYEPFGRAAKAQIGVEDDIRFAGGREDPDTGFVHLGDREYDPRLGRFISPDTVVPDPYVPAAYDRYAYGYNDPLDKRDPTGHAPEDLLTPYEEPRVSTAPRSARLLTEDLRMAPTPPSTGAERTGGDIVVIVTRDAGFGSHSALFIDRHGNPLLYDPGGTYRETARPPIRSTRGTVEGLPDGASLNRYVKFQKSTGSEVETYRFTLTAEEQAELIERITPDDTSSGEGEGMLFGIIPACAYHVSSVLQGIGPFKDLDTYLFPGNLADELDSLAHPSQSGYWGFMLGRLSD